MIHAHAIDLSPAEASALVQLELQEARHALHSASIGFAPTLFVTALGLGILFSRLFFSTT